MKRMSPRLLASCLSPGERAKNSNANKRNSEQRRKLPDETLPNGTSDRFEWFTSASGVAAVTGAVPCVPISMPSPLHRANIDEVDVARAQEYALLSRAARARARRGLARAPFAACAATQVRSALAHTALAEARAAPMSARSSANISISSSGSAAASFCPTARITSAVSCMSGRWRGCAPICARLGIERAEGQCRAGGSRGDPVRDHGGHHRRPALPAAARRGPRAVRAASRAWIGRFFADLERAEAADFYRRIGTLGRVFIDIETEAFALPA